MVRSLNIRTGRAGQVALKPSAPLGSFANQRSPSEAEVSCERADPVNPKP